MHSSKKRTAPINTYSSYLDNQSKKTLLRFITCGSVDDGKSTLLGRLLYDSKTVFKDQLESTRNESKKYGTQKNEMDLALLVDGLQAEREQGITIDVAYRYFETKTRKFIAADTPGHEQYTRNMVTGASHSDLAIILIDARKGILDQTKRHTFITSLLGIKNIILAINKMDLVKNSQKIYEGIKNDYKKFVEKIGDLNLVFIPLSALNGDNVFYKSSKIKWYKGITLIKHLEKISVKSNKKIEAFRLPIQWVNRPNLDFRGYSGNIASGKINVGDELLANLSQKKSKVKKIIAPNGEVKSAILGTAITLLLDDEIDISRGELLTTPDSQAQIADKFSAWVIWMDNAELLPERTYRIRFTNAEATAQVTELSHKIDVNTLDHHATKTLRLNEVGYCKISLDRPIAFDSYKENKTTGSFILIDKITNATVGAGIINFALRRANNISWHKMKVDKTLRSQMKHQKPRLIWLTGMSGSGKSTIADALEQKLAKIGYHTYILDGDNLRHGLNKDLGFTDKDRVENIRRVAEVGKLMVDAGLIVIASFISPFKIERDMVRSLFSDGEYFEVFVDAPLSVCEARDTKGLYKKARMGTLKNFTGIDSKYEPPDKPEIVLNSAENTPDQLTDKLMTFILSR